MQNKIGLETGFLTHQHRSFSEACTVSRGVAEEFLYNSGDNIVERIEIKFNSTCIGVNIKAGRWHSILSLESGTVFFEAKDGLYSPLTSDGKTYNLILQ